MKQKKYTYNFQQYETIRSFGESREDQSNLLENLVEFNNKFRPKNKEGRDKIRDAYESAYALYEG